MFLLPFPAREKTEQCIKSTTVTAMTWRSGQSNPFLEFLGFYWERNTLDISSTLCKIGGHLQELPCRWDNTWIRAVFHIAFTYSILYFLSNTFDLFLSIFCQNVQLISNKVQAIPLIFSLFHWMDSSSRKEIPITRRSSPSNETSPTIRHGALSWWFSKQPKRTQVTRAEQSRGTASEWQQERCCTYRHM